MTENSTNDVLDRVVRSEFMGCNPYTDEVIVLQARCDRVYVEVFVAGKWRTLMNCKATTTEIKDKRRLADMKRIIRVNTGWVKDDELSKKEIAFKWVENS